MPPAHHPQRHRPRMSLSRQGCAPLDAPSTASVRPRMATDKGPLRRTHAPPGSNLKLRRRIGRGPMLPSDEYQANSRFGDWCVLGMDCAVQMWDCTARPPTEAAAWNIQVRARSPRDRLQPLHPKNPSSLHPNFMISTGDFFFPQKWWRHPCPEARCPGEPPRRRTTPRGLAIVRRVGGIVPFRSGRRRAIRSWRLPGPTS